MDFFLDFLTQRLDFFNKVWIFLLDFFGLFESSCLDFLLDFLFGFSVSWIFCLDFLKFGFSFGFFSRTTDSGFRQSFSDNLISSVVGKHQLVDLQVLL